VIKASSWEMDDLKLYGRNDREIESLVHTVRIFSEDIGMQFGIDKCATIKLQCGEVKHSEGIVLPNAQVICEVKEDGYKYLGVLETDQIKHDEMKDKVKTGQESAAVKAEWRHHDRCHQHMGCVSSASHSWDYQLEER